jgi:hypothetical protein
MIRITNPQNTANANNIISIERERESPIILYGKAKERRGKKP